MKKPTLVGPYLVARLRNQVASQRTGPPGKTVFVALNVVEDSGVRAVHYSSECPFRR